MGGLLGGRIVTGLSCIFLYDLQEGQKEEDCLSSGGSSRVREFQGRGLSHSGTERSICPVGPVHPFGMHPQLRRRLQAVCVPLSRERLCPFGQTDRRARPEGSAQGIADRNSRWRHRGCPGYWIKGNRFMSRPLAGSKGSPWAEGVVNHVIKSLITAMEDSVCLLPAA